MNFLLSAFKHTFLLIIASIFVIIGMERVSYDNNLPFAKFCDVLKDQKVSIASALEICEIGEEATAEDIVHFSEYLFGSESKIVIPCSQSSLDFINTTMVGGYFAKFLYLYLLIGIATGFLCFIFKVGFPFRIGRKSKSIFDMCDDIVGATPNQTYKVLEEDIDGRLIERITYNGETRSCCLWFFLIILYIVLMVVWGLLIIPIIIIDIIIAILIFICQMITKNFHKEAEENKTASK